MCVLSSSVPPGEPHRRACRLLVLACHHGATHIHNHCGVDRHLGPPRTGNLSKTARIQSIRHWNIHVSHHQIGVQTSTRPASLQMRVMMLSNAGPRRPNIPACVQTARWWPHKSSGRPHRRLRAESGRTRRKLPVNWRWHQDAALQNGISNCPSISCTKTAHTME